VSITVSQLLAAINGLEKLGVDTSAAASLNLDSLPADLVVADEALSIVGIFIPPVAVAAAVLAVAIELEPLLPLISIGPDPDPENDGQTTLGQGGRRA
jgi:hypothetical protein